MLIILGAGVVGGLIGHVLKIPVGGLIGAKLAVIAVNMLLQPTTVFPDELRVGLQLLFGPMLGSRITKEDLSSLKKIAISAVVMIISMLLINIAIGVAIYNFSSLDVATALFASAPGGMMDMAIISAEFGANPAYVALMQFSRLMFIFVCMIPFYRKIMRKLKPEAHDNISSESIEMSEYKASLLAEDNARLHETDIDLLKRYGMTLLCGGTLGLALWALDIPAGAIIGAMLGSALYNVFSGGKAYFPPGIRLPLRIVAGIFFGMRFDRASVMALGEILIPLLILMIGVVVMTVVTAVVVNKLTKLDATTSMLASTPGGITEMALIADELGIDAPKVAVLHMARLVTVIVLFPSILVMVLRLVDRL